MGKKEYTWYVEPLDSQTNSIFSGQLPEEDFIASMHIDREDHKLWRCSYKQVAAFQRSKGHINLDFKVYNQRGNGKIRNCDFLFKKKGKAKAAS